MLAREETDLDYFSRRAMEESHAAAKTECRHAGAAHRHMAAAYAGKLRDEQLIDEDFTALLGNIDLADDDPRLDDAGPGETQAGAAP